MSNVIRPTFGRKAAPASAASAGPPPEEAYAPLRVYGTAAGHAVALIRDEAAPEGPVLKIVVGALAGSTVEAVAVMPPTPEGEAEAETTAMAILRALEIVEGSPDEPGAR